MIHLPVRAEAVVHYPGVINLVWIDDEKLTVRVIGLSDIVVTAQSEGGSGVSVDGDVGERYWPIVIHATVEEARRPEITALRTGKLP